MSMAIYIFVIFIIFFTLIVVSSAVSSAQKKSGPRSPIIEKSHDWHSPKGEYGENHEDIVDDHIIPHAQPEIGYVVLNGIKRKLEDCKWL
jgi:hypothetical protein